jgi:deoxyribonuclease V
MVKKKIIPKAFSVEKARFLQLTLSKQLILTDATREKIRNVGGVDVAYINDYSIGAAVVLDYETLQVKETQTAICKNFFPYIPTFLSFREIPPIVAAINRIKLKPNVWLVDGQGYAHPFRLGLASHLGIVLDISTIGVAKNLLCGEVGIFKDGIAVLNDKGEVIGAAVITNTSCKPVYVSVGHKISLNTAVNIVKHCTPKGRVPRPIQLAHTLALEEKRKIQNIKTI